MYTRPTTRNPPYLEREESYGEREEYEWHRGRLGAQSRRVTGGEAPAAPRSMTRRRRDIEPTPSYDEIPAERRQLFMDDGIDPATFTDIVMHDVVAEPADLQSLIAVMNPTQLATSLKHMALQYRDLQNAATGTWDTDEDDNRGRGPTQSITRATQGQQPEPSVSPPGRGHGREPVYEDEEEYLSPPPGEDAYRPLNTHDVRPHPAGHNTSADHDEGMGNSDPPRGPTATHRAPPATQQPTPPPMGVREAEIAPEEPTMKRDRRRQRMPAAKLETFAGQGAFVEAFLAKFTSHATYFGWTERDRVFQLKNSLTGTAAQALWAGRTPHYNIT